MLDEFLVGKRELAHGQSATMDVRRFVKTIEELQSLERICCLILIGLMVLGLKNDSSIAPGSKDLFKYFPFD